MRFDRRYSTMSVLLACAAIATAQVSDTVVSASRPTITEHLISTGRVSIEQDARLAALVGTSPRTYYGSARVGRSSDHIYMQGYRVRVFSGNNQNESKQTAYGIERDMREAMPDLDTYVVFKTPNWRLLVGNYRTSEEAVAALRALKRKFPTWGREMFVVKDEIEIRVND